MRTIDLAIINDYQDEDVLVAVNGVSVKTFDDWERLPENWKPGDEVELTILRMDKKITMPVTLIESSKVLWARISQVVRDKWTVFW